MSEIANISFGGVVNEPNDYLHEEESLSVSVNAVQQHESLRPIPPGEDKFTFDSSLTLVFVHDYNNVRNYIFADEEAYLVYYINEDDIDTEQTIDTSALTLIYDFSDDEESVMQVTSVRSILCISTSGGIRYARYADETYKYLGALPKMPYVYPFLRTDIIDLTYFQAQLMEDAISNTISGISDYGEALYTLLTDTDAREVPVVGELQNVLYTKFFEIINVMRAELHKDGAFTAPFYVRFAFRMYDGTYISVSRPYPMCPTSTYNPMVFIETATADAESGTITAANANVIMPRSFLQIYFDGVDEDWKDLIRGVDVFVSQEVVNYTDEAASIQTIANPAVLTDYEEQYLFDFCSNSWEDGEHPNLRHYKDNVSNHLTRLDKHTFHLKTLKVSDGFKVLRHMGKTYVYCILIPVSASGSLYTTSGTQLTPSTSGTYYSNVVTDLGEEYVTNYDVYFTTAPSSYYIYNGDDATIQVYQYYYEAVETADISVAALIKLGRTDGNTAEDVFKDVGTFYKLASYEYGDIDSGSVISPTIDEYILENIVTRPVLDEAVVRNYPFKATDIYSFNSRLNAIVEEQTLESPDYTDSFLLGYESGSGVSFDYKFYFEVVLDGTKYYIASELSESAEGARPYYLFYPSINATNAFVGYSFLGDSDFTSITDETIEVDGTTYTISSYDTTIWTYANINVLAKVPLKIHNTLTGAYAFNGFGSVFNKGEEYCYTTTAYYTIPTIATIEENVTYDTTPTDADAAAEAVQALIASKIQDVVTGWGYDGEINTTEGSHATEFGDDYDTYYAIVDGNSTFPVGNKILQSEVNNPFAFLNSTATQLQCDNIYRICATTKPISQGQFGDFPLYAFADNGVWALKTSSDGTYENVSPVSRDVCTDAESVTQLDKSIVFSTARGLMEIVGGDVNCVTEVLDGHNYTNDLSKLDEVLELADESFADISIPEHIKDYMDSAKLLYSYRRQHLYVYKEGNPLGYVYSFDSKTWGQWYNDGIAYSIGGYSEALWVKVDSDEEVSTLIDVSNEYSSESDTIPGLIVTRPIVLGTQDAYATIEEAVLRGVYDKMTSTTASGDFRMVIWASNDLKHWAIIGSSTTDRWRNYSGTPYKYYRFGVIANWQEQDSLNGISVTYTQRMTNKLR